MICATQSGVTKVWKTDDVDDAIDRARKFSADVCGTPESEIGMSRLWLTPKQPCKVERGEVACQDVKYLGWIFGPRNGSGIDWTPGKPCVFVTMGDDTA